MKYRKITLEDKGQDLLWFIIDEEGVVVEAGPFHNELYKGAYIPYDCVGDTENDEPPLFIVGDRCPIHNPPHLNHGWLDYNVKSIDIVEWTQN